MATKIIMPKQGLQMTEGTITRWLKKEGELVKEGEPLFEMETDKLTITIDSTAAGTLLKIVHGEGDVVPITETIAWIGDAGETIQDEKPAQTATPQASVAKESQNVSQPNKEQVLPEGVEKIILPKQGLQMTEGTITHWLKQEGDDIKEGEPLFEMETDKLTITIDSTATGTILKLLAKDGDTVPITETIALVGKRGTDVSSFSACGGNASSDKADVSAPAVASTSAPTEVKAIQRKQGERIFITPRARTRAEERHVDIESVPGSGPEGLIIERDVLAAPEIRATPAARDVAASGGVRLSDLTGNGLGGRIVVQDVLNAMRGSQPTAEIPMENSATEAGEEKAERLTGMRKAIWENMSRSLHEMAQAQHKIRVDMTECTKLRKVLKAKEQSVSYNDILILALTKALAEYPYLNAHVIGKDVYLKKNINIGIAVAVENGLIVPTVRNCQSMNLGQIHAAASAQIKKAQSGTLTPDDYTDGTFTVTNLGMFGLDEFTAIINPPQTGILAIGAIIDTPVVRDGQIVARPICTMTLTYDHRVIDGAPAAKFLAKLKTLLEEPLLML